MAWLAVDKDGQECIFAFEPIRRKYCFDAAEICDIITNSVELPEGSIKKLIGRELTWEDEPVEI